MQKALARMSPQTKGILAMALAAALLSGHDAITKHLSENYPLGQVIAFRQIASMVFLSLFIQFGPGWAALKIQSLKGQVLRAVTFIVATVLIVASVSVLPLATALSIVFASPLVLAALSVPLLRERVGVHRWLAIFGGFVGVLVVIRPIDPAFDWLLLVPVVAATASALRDIATRLISRTEQPIAILFWSNLAMIVAAVCTLPFGFETIIASDYGWIVFAGLLNVLAHFLMITALRLADAALVAPFRYSALVWAVLLGFVVWGHMPDGWTFAGALIIVVSGIYLVLREQRTHQSGRSIPQRP